jgi:DNA-binding MarR family transcriptional regulator
MAVESTINKPISEIEDLDNIGFLIHETAQAITVAWGTVMSPLGLTRPQVRVIAWVDHSPGITQAELSARLGITAMSLTGLLDRMELKHLVTRTEDPADRRVKRIFLTQAALKLKPEMEVIANEFRKAVHEGVSQKDLATTFNVLNKFRTNIKSNKR